MSRLRRHDSVPDDSFTPRLRPVLVTDDRQLAEMLRRFSSAPAVAVDTESNSLYAYQERVCLIQFSTPDADYLVDPLADVDLSPLGDLFADPDRLKVFHAAEYDVMCLKRDFGFRFAGLFDTMWAARILGWPRVGLGDILKETFGVRSDKRFQRYNWGQRPLPQKALAYAALDTHYLLPLYHRQAAILRQAGRWEEAQETFARIAASRPLPVNGNTVDIWRIKGVHDLSPREWAVLQELARWRDEEARRRDVPLFKVLHDRTLVALAQARPRTLNGLREVRGLSANLVRRYGQRLLETIRRGERARPPTPPPPPPRHSDAEVARYQALRAWRREVAARRGVDPDVIVGNAVLWELAERNPVTEAELARVAELGDWKRRTYGADILRVLRRLSPR